MQIKTFIHSKNKGLNCSDLQTFKYFCGNTQGKDERICRRAKAATDNNYRRGEQLGSREIGDLVSKSGRNNDKFG